MVASDLREADQTSANPEEQAPSPSDTAKPATDVAPSTSEASLAWRVEVNVIRSVYVARNIVPEAASSGDFANMETTTDGGARRGAFLAHLADAEPTAAGVPDLEDDDMLRSVYVARTVAADPGARPRPARGKRRKRAAAPSPKAAKRKTKTATRAKAKKRAAGRGRRRRR